MLTITTFDLNQLTPITTPSGNLEYKSALPAKAEYRLRSTRPRKYRQHGALDYKSANRKQACALCFQRPSPPLCVIGARDAARGAPMTLPLRHGSLPARYRANKEKNHGLRKGFLKATAMQKAHIASACKKPLLRLTGKQQAEYSLPHENPSARFACWRQNKTSGGWYQWPGGAGQHYITGIIHPARGWISLCKY